MIRDAWITTRIGDMHSTYSFKHDGSNAADNDRIANRGSNVPVTGARGCAYAACPAIVARMASTLSPRPLA